MTPFWETSQCYPARNLGEAKSATLVFVGALREVDPTEYDLEALLRTFGDINVIGLVESGNLDKDQLETMTYTMTTRAGPVVAGLAAYFRGVAFRNGWAVGLEDPFNVQRLIVNLARPIEDIVYEPSPTCTANCGTLCLGYYCHFLTLPTHYHYHDGGVVPYPTSREYQPPFKLHLVDPGPRMQWRWWWQRRLHAHDLMLGHVNAGLATLPTTIEVPFHSNYISTTTCKFSNAGSSGHTSRLLSSSCATTVTPTTANSTTARQPVPAEEPTYDY
ncbi:hypothetical protein BJ170DRAFT_716087 [Xylariales sp. AK1849]|nr:hypothetical protein BJ170DRAFT_716087 [Xylariales sp. AK1849]